MSDETTVTPPAREQGRDEDGTFLPGHQLQRTHGASAFKNRGEAALSPDQRAELAAFRDAVISDQGELSAVREGYIRRIVEVEAICQLIGADLRARGVFTQKGYVRKPVLSFLLAVDRWDRLAQRLGLDRRSKRVPSLDEIMREAAP